MAPCSSSPCTETAWCVPPPPPVFEAKPLETSVSFSGLRGRGERDALCDAQPWRQPRSKWMVSVVNSHTYASSKRLHLWEIDLRCALNSTRGWCTTHTCKQHAPQETRRLGGGRRGSHPCAGACNRCGGHHGCRALHLHPLPCSPIRPASGRTRRRIPNSNGCSSH